MNKMRVKDLTARANKKMSAELNNTASVLENAIFVTKLDDLMLSRGITQRELSALTGIPLGTISDLITGKSNTVNKLHLVSLMSALRVTNVEEIFEVKVPDELKEEFQAEAQQWINTGKMPEKVHNIFRDNIVSKAGLDKK